jgi:hypothetical protein
MEISMVVTYWIFLGGIIDVGKDNRKRHANYIFFGFGSATTTASSFVTASDLAFHHSLAERGDVSYELTSSPNI